MASKASMLGLLGIGMACLVAAARGEEQKPVSGADRTRQVLARFRETVPEVSFEDKRFEDVIEWFRLQGLKNIIVDWPAIKDTDSIRRDSPVSLSLSGLPLGELLDLVLEQVSSREPQPENTLTYQIQNGVIRIAPRSVFARELITRVYYIEDVIQPIPFWNDAPRIGLHDGPAMLDGGGTGGFVGLQRLRLENLEDLITTIITSIEPDSWEDRGGPGTIVNHEYYLVITNTLEVHEKIGGVRP
jgi:hypothetical protein